MSSLTEGKRWSARERALYLLEQVEEKGAYTNLLIDWELRRGRWSVEDKAFLTELVNGTVRMKKHLDWVLNLFLPRPVAKQDPRLRNLLRLTGYQLLFMDHVPDYAAVDEAVSLARRNINHSASRLVNAVLRNVVRSRSEITYPDRRYEPVRYLAVYYSHPEWMVERWLARYGFNITEQLLQYNNLPPEITVRTNTLKTNVKELLESLLGYGCECRISPLVPWGIRISHLSMPLRALPAYQAGWFYIQGEASMLVSYALSPRPFQLVYDMAAGVGGKTTHLAELMDNKGTIRAMELYPHKLRVLEDNKRRLGITTIEARAGSTLESLPEYWEAGDRVLLDAPCSGLGVLRRRADARWRKKPSDIEQLSCLQRRMLESVAPLAKPTGLLVYSTCTLEPEENEQVIKTFLADHPEFVLDSLAEPLAFFPWAERDRDRAGRGMTTLFPPDYGIDGMFIARLRRRP